MGWTYMPSLGKDTIAILKDDFATENQHGKWEWLDHAVRGSTVYAVLKFTPKTPAPESTYQTDADGSYRFITVFLTSRRGRDGYDFGYKDITEPMGPYEKDCPTRLIRLASPLRIDDKSFAREWRAACLAKKTANRDAKAALPKPGQTFRTASPVKFNNGAEHSIFTCERIMRRGRNITVYRAEGSTSLYRFKPRDFEILPTQPNDTHTP